MFWCCDDFANSIALNMQTISRGAFHALDSRGAGTPRHRKLWLKMRYRAFLQFHSPKKMPRRSGAVSESYFFSSDGGDDVSVGAHCQTLTLPSLTSWQSLAAAAVEITSAAAIKSSFISTSANANSPIAPADFPAQPLWRQTSPTRSAGFE
jgi:hypothetical protein